MTTFTYRCADCGSDWDRVYPIGMPARSIECPATGCDGLAYKTITAPAVHIANGTKAGYVKR